jgi:hypothetical protein
MVRLERYVVEDHQERHCELCRISEQGPVTKDILTMSHTDLACTSYQLTV